MICDENICCGCGGCVNICPRQCIELKEDDLGCLVPVIDNAKCVYCNLCKSVCPKINEVTKHQPIKCYAAYKKNAKERLDCASGGVADSFYRSCFSSSEKWVFTGVELNEELHAVMVLTGDQIETEKFKGSKYVQAFPAMIYKEVGQALKLGENVLFIGMPCQVAACLNYLDRTKIDHKKLVTVDLLCHGVSPQKYLDEDIMAITQKHKWKNIDMVTFRSNQKYRNFHFSLKNGNSGKNGNCYIYDRYAVEDDYFCGFLRGITLRESCYSCQFSSLSRVSDITIGDFIGLGKDIPFEGQAYNASLILCNTENGIKFVQNATADLHLFEREIEEAYRGVPSLQKPFARSIYRDAFLENYKTMKFNEAFDKAVGKAFAKEKRICTIKRMIQTVILNLKY